MSEGIKHEKIKNRDVHVLKVILNYLLYVAPHPPPADLSETAITVFSVLGLFSSQATASLCILFTAEIMPTIIR